jgi:hypothetical protein
MLTTFIGVLVVCAVIGWIDSAIRQSADFDALKKRWSEPTPPPAPTPQPVQPTTGRRIILDANAQPISSASPTSFDTRAYEGNWLAN